MPYIIFTVLYDRMPCVVLMGSFLIDLLEDCYFFTVLLCQSASHLRAWNVFSEDSLAHYSPVLNFN